VVAGVTGVDAEPPVRCCVPLTDDKEPKGSNPEVVWLAEAVKSPNKLSTGVVLAGGAAMEKPPRRSAVAATPLPLACEADGPPRSKPSRSLLKDAAVVAVAELGSSP